MGESMRQMLDTRSSAASATQFSRLCKPSSEAVQKNCWQSRWGSVPESGAYHPVLLSAFVKTVFSQRKIYEFIKRNLEPQHSKNWRDLVTVCRQKKAEHVTSRLTDQNVVWRPFLNTEQLLARRVKHHQLDREDNHALLGGLPVGEGDALEQSFVKDLGAVKSISSCRKYPRIAS